MNELISVSPRQIGEATVLTADARGLHAYLGPDTEFSHWITRRIEEYEFEDGKDFQSFLAESTGGRPPKEYTLTLNMAKELAMVERTPKGKEARQYFIECERRALAIDGSALPSPEKARPARVSERYREAAAITRDSLKIYKLLGVDAGMAKVIAAKEVRAATGLDFTPLLTNVTATNNPRLTPKELAACIGVGATSEQVNAALAELGFQAKEHWTGSKGKPRSKWVLTDAGKKHGALATYQAQEHQHSGYRPVWYASVIELIRPLVEVAIAQRPAPKPKRPKVTLVPSPEPQGALL